MIGERFAPLTIMSNEGTDSDSMITTFNTTKTKTAREIIGKHRQKKKTKKKTTKKPGSLQQFLICATKVED